MAGKKLMEIAGNSYKQGDDLKLDSIDLETPSYKTFFELIVYFFCWVLSNWGTEIPRIGERSAPFSQIEIWIPIHLPESYVIRIHVYIYIYIIYIYVLLYII